ncbi:single-stranded DNA-binding protein [Spirillospora sp. NPDC047279]|uniref:single-stranded DNA-binding protein n=1 Tax=Spirillospora sp. NPDC047279 TaxID=3155478 RepID=UPI0033D234B3
MTCPHVNDVVLLGRLAEDPLRRDLPSGLVVAWRLIVDRPRSEPGRRRMVDTLACASWVSAVADQSSTWRRGDLIEVRGSLRRRFWKGDDLRIGRYEVEVYDAALVAVSPTTEPEAAEPEAAVSEAAASEAAVSACGVSEVAVFEAAEPEGAVAEVAVSEAAMSASGVSSAAVSEAEVFEADVSSGGVTATAASPDAASADAVCPKAGSP